MVLSCRRMPVESRKKGNSCLFPMKTFTAVLMLRRVYPMKLVSASCSLRETHCDKVASEHHGFISLWLLAAEGSRSILGVKGMLSPRLHGFSGCYLPIPRQSSRAPVRH